MAPRAICLQREMNYTLIKKALCIGTFASQALDVTSCPRGHGPRRDLAAPSYIGSLQSVMSTGFTGSKLHGTLTYLKYSTMLVTIPVTISTIPRTQNRPVHEVKSTYQEGRRRHLSDDCLNWQPSHTGPAPHQEDPELPPGVMAVAITC
jgi:hypothetical protein